MMEHLSAQFAYDNLSPPDWDVCKICGKVHFSSREFKDCLMDAKFNDMEDEKNED